MQIESEQQPGLLQALLDDLNILLGDPERFTPEVFADSAVRELTQKLSNFLINTSIHDQLKRNTNNPAAVVLLRSESFDEMEFEIIPNFHGFMHELHPPGKFPCYAESPTPASEIIALYLFLKEETLDLRVQSKTYDDFLREALRQLSNGAIAHLVQILPPVARHNYRDDIARYKDREKLFKDIERHLFAFSGIPIEQLDAYITRKSSSQQLDKKLRAAKDIRNQFYQLIVKCVYEDFNAIDMFVHMKDIIVNTTRSHLECNVDAVIGYYRKLIRDIFAHIDQISSKYLTHVTHYRALVSADLTEVSYSNKVTHLTDASFGMSHCNRLQLFNNAASNEFADDNGAYNQIMTSIENATSFILILGWEFSPQLVFHRKNDPATHTLGEILVDKACENPNMVIAIMVWSQYIPFLGNIGSQTHVEALKYLQELSEKRHGRQLPTNLSLQFASRPSLWLGANTHHQKMVITDTPSWPFARGFYGGLDLTTGRFDYNHQLLTHDEYLQKYHQTRDQALLNQLPKEERRWTNADICNLDKSNPFRTPWHDIHSRVEGNAVLDLMAHFRQHWVANWNKKSPDIIPIMSAKMRQAGEQFATSKERDTSDFIWKSQVLRSHTRANCGHWSLGSPFENSIMHGYVALINSAERFIYIENQYFIGGGKKVHDQERHGNLIPTAIANKIIAKHKAGQEFHVFIILPLYPEDGPESSASNEVRRKQHDSMHWLLGKINKHTDNNALNYVSFLWLGEWNGKDAQYDNLVDRWRTTREELIRSSRRYPIYVHSKFMIVDDKFVINGSANINERSMMGIRDSEIAVLQIPEKDKHKECGEMLLQFRKQLWQQYFGQDCLRALGEDGMENPHTGPAVSTIQHYAKIHLQCYIDNEEGRRPGQGHLMTFPYHAPPALRAQLVYLPDTPRAYRALHAHKWLLDRDNIAPDEHISQANKFMDKMIPNEFL